MRCKAVNGIVRVPDLDGCIERNQSLGKVARIGCYALVAGAEHGLGPVEAANGGTARARIAFVAGGIGDIAEIGATRALQDVAAKARHVADLLAGRELKRLRDDRILLPDLRMVRRVGHAYQ